MSINWGIYKYNVEYAYTRILFSNKKELLILATSWVNLTNIMLSERN